MALDAQADGTFIAQCMLNHALDGVQADDLNVSCEVLEMPQKTGFLGLKLTPAKVCVSVEEPDAPAAAPAEPVVEKKTPVQEAVKAAPVAEEPAAAAAQPEAKAEEPAAPAAEAAAEQPAAEEEEPEVPIVIEENAKIKAAVDYEGWRQDLLDRSVFSPSRRWEDVTAMC